jgi:hypothetical protein
MNESWELGKPAKSTTALFESTSNIDEKNARDADPEALSRQNVAARKTGSSRGQSAIRFNRYQSNEMR